MRLTFTRVVSKAVPIISLGMEFLTFRRFYLIQDTVLTIESCLFVIVCLYLNVLIWRAHWSMTYDDPGFINDSPSIVAASNLPPLELSELIKTTISRLTGLDMEVDADACAWPDVYLTFCHKCDLIKSSYVHHCSMCEKCIFMMDHHCCFSDRCIGYYSFKPFV